MGKRPTPQDGPPLFIKVVKKPRLSTVLFSGKTKSGLSILTFTAHNGVYFLKSALL
jgi:hypothetical protein